MTNPKPRRPAEAGDDGTLVRLNRYLSIAGVSSRRRADEYIQEGRVSVNGRVIVSLGSKVRPGRDSIFLDGKQIVALDPKVYILLNKPKDCITTLSDEKGRRSVLDVVKYPRRIFPVGRLDRNTTGALILTNDGDFANALMHPRNKVPKSYLVTTNSPVSAADLRKLADGISLPEGRTAPAGVELIPGSKNRVVGITIREGRNRQIHRMFQAVGYLVEKLDRVAYGPVACEGLSRGQWRHLSPAETRTLTGMAGEPSTTRSAAGNAPRGPRTRSEDSRISHRADLRDWKSPAGSGSRPGRARGSPERAGKDPAEARKGPPRTRSISGTQRKRPPVRRKGPPPPGLRRV